MEIILALFLGILVGYFIKLSDGQKKINGKLQQLGVVFLLFSMGASIGANDKIIRDLPVIGVKAFAFAALTILGSIILVYVLSNKFLKTTANEEQYKESIEVNSFAREIEVEK